MFVQAKNEKCLQQHPSILTPLTMTCKKWLRFKMETTRESVVVNYMYVRFTIATVVEKLVVKPFKW